MASSSSNGHHDSSSSEGEAAIQLFCDLLRFKTVSFEGPGSGAYRACTQWLVETLGGRLGLETQVLEPVPGKPIVLATWKGQDPSLPSILLNSHYDVVPAVTDHWATDPFEPTRKDGRIYARGTQDMKCVCAQYILAVERLKQSGVPPLRTVHLSFVPDEEIGGADGMAKLLEAPLFKEGLNVGIALDEGIANPEDAFTFFYGERMPLWIRVRAQGNTGHGSRFIPDTAVGKIVAVAQKALEFRAQQEKTLGHTHDGCKHAQAKKLGDVTSLNLTVLKAGVSTDGGNTFAFNVIPHEAEAGFDMRVPPSVPFSDIRALLDQWTAEEGVSWEFAKEGGGNPLTEHHVTSTDRGANPWFGVFYDSLAKRGVPLSPEVFPASTDARFVRAAKLPAFGFSPMRNTPILLHEHNEFIPEGVFLEGVDVFATLIQDLASAPRFDSEIPACVERG